MEPPKLVVGDRVRIAWSAGEKDAEIIMASENSRSLVVGVEAIIGGFLGTIPLLWENEGYVTLSGEPVDLKPIEK